MGQYHYEEVMMFSGSTMIFVYVCEFARKLWRGQKLNEVIKVFVLDVCK